MMVCWTAPMTMTSQRKLHCQATCNKVHPPPCCACLCCARDTEWCYEPSCRRRPAGDLAQGGVPLPALHCAFAINTCFLLHLADDDLLITWRKVESPFLHLPPADLQLTGWRDPFIFTSNTAAAPSESCDSLLVFSLCGLRMTSS